MTKPTVRPTRLLSPCLAFLVSFALGAITQAWFGAPEVVTVIVMAAAAYGTIGWIERNYVRQLVADRHLRRARTRR